MREQEDKEIVRRYFEEVWNKGDLDAADELIDRNFSVEGRGGAISGLDAVKLYVSSYRSVYPSVHFTILSLAAEDGRVVACWVGRGMHCATDDCQDEAPVAQECPATGLSVYRIAGGKIAEAWAGSDHQGLGSVRRLGISRDLS